MLSRLYNSLCRLSALSSPDLLTTAGSLTYASGKATANFVNWLSRAACNGTEALTRKAVQGLSFVSETLGKGSLAQKFAKFSQETPATPLRDAHLNEIASSLALLWMVYSYATANHAPPQHFAHDLLQDPNVQTVLLAMRSSAMVAGIMTRREHRAFIRENKLTADA